ncbi:MAG TPA: TonB-dependent receptor [Vicinamibacteria bacterium]|nr:TonB-dependent receptor [Vicinamibacteria bacterium]
MRRRILALAAALVCLGLPAWSQTNPTGTLSGKVVDEQGLPIPGATVTAQSPALQGVRSTTTSANGDYVIPFLPPGEYTVSFELTGFKTIQNTTRVSPGDTKVVTATLPLTTITETVTVTGQPAGDIGQGAAVATSFKNDLVEKLPLNRTLQQAALLTPGVQGTGPNGNVVVNGAMSFESLYLVNGVVVNENLRGQAQNLYIEDALQETTITTASVSAEYGRFQGGVVNSITKSGGNQFSGSFRTTFDNDRWRALTFYEQDRLDRNLITDDPRTDTVIPTYEATLGGPLLKDKLWFFGAARMRDFKETRITSFTNLNFDRELNEKRYEGKLTWALTPNHTLKAGYMKIQSKENGNSFGTIMDLASVVNRELPNDLLSANYTGILSSNFFVEAQYSRRQFSFVNSGSQYTDPIKGTLMLDQSRSNARFWSPTFCGVCDDEKRDNQNIIAKASYFLSTGKAGSHNLVAGFDMFDDKRFANNHQSGSDYRVYATSTLVQGSNVSPVFDSNTFIRWTPIFVSSEGNRFRTVSVFLNDAWTFNKHLSFNLGLRYDKNDGRDSQGVVRVKDSAFSPRLSGTFDPKGDGKLSARVSYAQYVAAIANSVGDSASAGGQPATIDFDYLGPLVNTGNPANPIPTDQALQTLFGWFNANGGTSRTPRGAPSVPGVNTAIADGLKSPNTQEFVVGLAARLGSRGSVRVDGVYRKFRDFYASRTDLTTGQVKDQYGKSFDLQVTENTGDLERTYRGVNVQISYPIGKLGLGGNYTYGHVQGNVEGETGGSGPGATGVYAYPEYFSAVWAFPEGDLASDVRHKVRFWSTWDTPLPQAAGKLSLGLLQFFSSGSPYGSAGTVDTRPYVTNPGYATPPSSRTYWFEPRDTYKTEDLWRTDLSLNYSHRIAGSAEVFFRGTVLNVFNRSEFANLFDGGCGTGGCIDTTIQTNRQVTSLARFNPFTQEPVEGVNWRKGSSFGNATSRYAYQTPRTYGFSIGVRF